MADWPKTIIIRGISIPIASFDELDELIERYGAEGPLIIQGDPAQTPPRRTFGNLAPSDRSLLQQFVTGGENGVRTNQLGPALGTSGRGIRPALDVWARRIGLVTQDGVSAFQRTKTVDGRGFGLTSVYLNAARTMLE